MEGMGGTQPGKQDEWPTVLSNVIMNWRRTADSFSHGSILGYRVVDLLYYTSSPPFPSPFSFLGIRIQLRDMILPRRTDGFGCCCSEEAEAVDPYNTRSAVGRRQATHGPLTMRHLTPTKRR